MLKVFRHSYQVFAFPDVHASAGHVHIAVINRTDKAGKRNVIGPHTIEIEFHMNFALQPACQTCLQNPGDGFQPILHILGQVLQPPQAEGAR